MFAVEFVMQRDSNQDGSTTVTQTVTVTEKINRTYSQSWTAYNAAQTNEKEKFLALLYDLCRNVETPVQKNGRPRLPFADAIFTACYKVYSTYSGRRFMSDLRAAQEKGYIQKVPHFNSIFNTLENADLFPILKKLIVESSLPLKHVDVDFAVDSSGFSASRFDKWFDEKYRQIRSGNTWVKAHICCGVKTNIVTAVEIHDRHASDSPQLPALVSKTAESFSINEVRGDKASGSRTNFANVESHGGTAFIAFKRGSTGGVGGMY